MAHEVLKMYHPELDAIGECTADSFRQIYQFRGWTLMDQTTVFATAQLGSPVGELDSLTQDQLLQVAVAATNQDFAKNTSKAKLIKAIKDGVPEGATIVLEVDDNGVERDADGNIVDDPNKES